MKSLSDQRKEILDHLLDMIKSNAYKEEWTTILEETFSIIEDQDKKFIIQLKNEIGNCYECGSTLTVEQINKLAGDKLI